jgi:hypothetical protein
MSSVRVRGVARADLAESRERDTRFSGSESGCIAALTSFGARTAGVVCALFHAAAAASASLWPTMLRDLVPSMPRDSATVAVRPNIRGVRNFQRDFGQNPETTPREHQKFHQPEIREMLQLFLFGSSIATPKEISVLVFE